MITRHYSSIAEGFCHRNGENDKHPATKDALEKAVPESQGWEVVDGHIRAPATVAVPLQRQLQAIVTPAAFS
jgi:hypothetical protein